MVLHCVSLCYIGVMNTAAKVLTETTSIHNFVELAVRLVSGIISCI